MKGGNPTISVIMGVYNQFDKAALFKAVRSILVQSFSDFEFIIYDDGSDPMVGAYIKELEELDDRIKVIGRTENHGLAFSLNRCLFYARGKYIARMDADDVSLPNRFELQLDFLKKNPDVSWCGGNAMLFNENGIYGERKMPARPTKEDYLRYSPYIHPTVMYRREVLDVCKGYSEKTDALLCEDYEIFMRLKSLGFYGANIQQTLLEYCESSASYLRRSFKRRINEAKVRYRSFKRLNILWPTGWLYVFRPIVAFFVPNSLIGFVKRREARNFENVAKQELHSEKRVVA